jgi:hypothetical protein
MTIETLEDFLRNSGTIDFRLRAEPAGESGVSCYIHPIDRHGATIFFDVDANTLTLKSGILIEPSEDPLTQTPFIVCDNPDMKLSDLGINLGNAE